MKLSFVALYTPLDTTITKYPIHICYAGMIQFEAKKLPCSLREI